MRVFLFIDNNIYRYELVRSQPKLTGSIKSQFGGGKKKKSYQHKSLSVTRRRWVFSQLQLQLIVGYLLCIWCTFAHCTKSPLKVIKQKKIKNGIINSWAPGKYCYSKQRPITPPSAHLLVYCYHCIVYLRYADWWYRQQGDELPLGYNKEAIVISITGV